MKVELNKVITGINKQPLTDQDGELTIKKAILIALVQPNPDAAGTNPEDALKSRKLFDKIDSAEADVELKAEEIVKIKNLVSKRLSEIVAGSVILALEPEA